MRDLALPPAPPLFKPEIAAPTPQEKPRAADGGLEDLSHCRYCYGYHPGACPFVRIIEWHPNGQVSRVVLKDRLDQEKLIIYPGEEADEALRLGLEAIGEAKTLGRAREIAAALLKVVGEEKPA